ncbi:MAG: hypothetical protein V3U87_09890 [Methylococcaceae bacterium]
MKSISKRYSDIFNKYYAKTAKSRFNFFIGFIDSWMSKIVIGNEFAYIVDHERLSKTIDSYFLDVIKYKEYHFNASVDDIYSETWCKEVHEEHKINDSKVAAFTAKWLLKAAPISIIPRNITSSIHRPENDNLCHINERFALDCALYALFRDDYLSLDDKSYDSLYYDFKYRNFDERAYFSRFSLLLNLVKERGERIDTHEKNETQKEGKKSVTAEKKEEIKIFIASADDVKNLRKATKDVIEQLNLPYNRKYNLVPWMWEHNKSPGHLGNETQYQQEVFQEFGKHCDVFILLFWAKLGEGTIKEYEYFKTEFKKHNPNTKFFACEYGKSFDHKQAEDVAKLNTWLDKENKYWAPIGGVRKSIKSVKKYKESLSKHLLEVILDLN